jgi:hypothetical protein
MTSNANKSSKVGTQLRLHISQSQSFVLSARERQVLSQPKRSREPVRMEFLSPWQLSSTDKPDSS